MRPLSTKVGRRSQALEIRAFLASTSWHVPCTTAGRMNRSGQLTALWATALLAMTLCLGSRAEAGPRMLVPSHELVHRQGQAPRLRVRQLSVTPQTARQKACRNTFADLAAWTSATLIPIGHYTIPRNMERGWAGFFALLPPELHTCEAINDEGKVLVRPDLYAALRHPGRRASDYGVATALHELMHSASRQDGGSRRDGVMKRIRDKNPEAASTVHLYFEEAAAEVSTVLLMTLRTGRPYWRDHKLAYPRATRKLAGYLLDKTGSPGAAIDELRRLVTTTDPAALVAEADAVSAWLKSGKRSPYGAMGKMAAELGRRVGTTR